MYLVIRIIDEDCIMEKDLRLFDNKQKAIDYKEFLAECSISLIEEYYGDDIKNLDHVDILNTEKLFEINDTTFIITIEIIELQVF